MVITIQSKDGSYSFDDVNEIWKPISECPEHYEVSNMGRIKSLDRWTSFGDNKKFIASKVLSLKFRKGKYTSINLSVNAFTLTKSVHILVAKEFIANPFNLPAVNHKKGLKWDNRFHELEWISYSNNQLHALDMGLNTKRKLTADDVRYIRASTYSDNMLAAMFNVRPGNIWNIKNNKSWKHIV